MEKILGVSKRNSEKRHNAHKADMLEQDENRDSARQRYQRLYWESVPIEGQVSILDNFLAYSYHFGRHRNPSLRCPSRVRKRPPSDLATRSRKLNLGLSSCLSFPTQNLSCGEGRGLGTRPKRADRHCSSLMLGVSLLMSMSVCDV